MLRTRGATLIAGRRPLARMVGGPRPWGGLRSVNLAVKEPTGQPVEPTKTTKARLVRSLFLYVFFFSFFFFFFSFLNFSIAVKNGFSGLFKVFFFSLFFFFFSLLNPVVLADAGGRTCTIGMESGE